MYHETQNKPHSVERERHFMALFENSIVQNYDMPPSKITLNNYHDYFKKLEENEDTKLNLSLTPSLSPTIQTMRATTLAEKIKRINTSLYARGIDYHVANVTLETPYYTHNDVPKLRKYINQLVNMVKLRLKQSSERTRGLMMCESQHVQKALGTIDVSYFECTHEIPLAQPRYRFVVEFIVLTNIKVNKRLMKNELSAELSRKSDAIKKTLQFDTPKYPFAVYVQNIDKLTPTNRNDNSHTALDVLSRNDGYFVPHDIFDELDPTRHVHLMAFSNIYRGISSMSRYHECGLCKEASSPLGIS